MELLNGILAVLVVVYLVLVEAKLAVAQVLKHLEMPLVKVEMVKHHIQPEEAAVASMVEPVEQQMELVDMVVLDG